MKPVRAQLEFACSKIHKPNPWLGYFFAGENQGYAPQISWHSSCAMQLPPRVLDFQGLLVCPCSYSHLWFSIFHFPPEIYIRQCIVNVFCVEIVDLNELLGYDQAYNIEDAYKVDGY